MRGGERGRRLRRDRASYSSSSLSSSLPTEAETEEDAAEEEDTKIMEDLESTADSFLLHLIPFREDAGRREMMKKRED